MRVSHMISIYFYPIKQALSQHSIYLESVGENMMQYLKTFIKKFTVLIYVEEIII